MTGELLLIGLAVIVTAGLLTPVGRHLLRTLVDVVDGSLALYSVRRTLGLDTTTRRERRIARRRAAEQADLERRIGVGDVTPTTPIAQAPNRLVASGEPPEAAIGTPVPARVADGMGGRPRVARRRHLLDAAAALAVIVVAIVGVNLVRTPTGAVLEATGRPAPAASPGPVSSLGPVGTPAPVIRPTPTPTASAAATPAAVATPTAAATAATPVGITASTITFGPTRHRLTGRRAGGPTVEVRLAWSAADAAGRRGAAAGITGYRLFASVGDGAPREVDTLPPNTTSVVRTIPIGRTTTFQLRLADDAAGTGPVATWPAIRPSRHQESSPRIAYRGTWRTAEGPSLSGGAVRYSAGTAGDRATVRFRGTDVGWVATMTPTSGRARIILDGRAIATVDLRAATVRYRQLVFRRHLADEGPHALQIRPVGDGRVDLDAIIVLR